MAKSYPAPTFGSTYAMVHALNPRKPSQSIPKYFKNGADKALGRSMRDSFGNALLKLRPNQMAATTIRYSPTRLMSNGLTKAARTHRDVMVYGSTKKGFTVSALVNQTERKFKVPTADKALAKVHALFRPALGKHFGTSLSSASPAKRKAAPKARKASGGTVRVKAHTKRVNGKTVRIKATTRKKTR